MCVCVCMCVCVRVCVKLLWLLVFTQLCLVRLTALNFFTVPAVLMGQIEILNYLPMIIIISFYETIQLLANCSYLVGILAKLNY